MYKDEQKHSETVVMVVILNSGAVLPPEVRHLHCHYAILLKEHSILQGHAASSVCIFVVTDSCSRIMGPNKALKELDEDPRRPRTNCHWL